MIKGLTEKSMKCNRKFPQYMNDSILRDTELRLDGGKKNIYLKRMRHK
jgi:hypothetical protein